MYSEQILVVDDEKTILELARRFLTGEGYSVEMASNGMDALRVLEQKPITVLLTDVRMPGMSGLELMKLARASYPDLVIMVITGHGTVTTAIEALKLGAMGFTLKPFTHQELISMVQHATQKNRLAKENLRLRSLMPLFEVNRRLLGETDPELLLHKAVEIVQRETRADKVSLMLLDANGNEATVRVSAGSLDRVDEKKIIEVSREISRRALADGKPIRMSSGSREHEDLRKNLGEEQIGSILSFPMMHRKKVIGALTLFKSAHSPGFSESDIELTSILCGQSAVAIENARLYQAIQSSHLRTLEALVAAIEIKDLASRGHSTKVARYATVLGRRLCLSKEEIQELNLASILHDIGKIASSDEILEKPGRLTEGELAEMKGHPGQAIKILQSIGLPSPVIRAIRHHHERWDGSGYPDGLAEEKIPLFSRLIALADAIDTLTSERPYHKAISFEEARRVLWVSRGTQFDPKLVDLLQELDDKALIGPAAQCSR